MMEKYVLVFDCGATNVRVIAMTPSGRVKASQSYPNRTVEDPLHPGGKIWPLEEIWSKLCKASKAVTSRIDVAAIVGVSTTTFGVDGTFVDNMGKPLYPVISWQCERTAPIMKGIDRYIPLEELYRKSGVYPYNFNTINKLAWFKENHPQVFADDARFLFMPSLLVNLLTGQQVNDSTMLGTSMVADINTRQVSGEILDCLGITPEIFLPCEHPGHIAGKITAEASKATGIPTGVPVCLSGHDTQFAVFGSGAVPGELVLSSGTWEVLMCRSQRYTTSQEQLDLGITTEFDAEGGYYNIGLNYIGSGLLEWVRKLFYADTDENIRYETMIREAQNVPVGSNGIRINPGFYDPAAEGSGGRISGLRLHSTRGEVYRACLEALSLKLRTSLQALETAGHFKASKIICVGGGSRNYLWNQVKADVCGIPVQLIQQKETTVLGSALFTFTGVGYFPTLEEARANIPYEPGLIYPSQQAADYKNLLTN